MPVSLPARTRSPLRYWCLAGLLVGLTYMGRADAPCSSCLPPAAETPAPTRGHPLRGVVVRALPEQGALMVKHEEIPGVMRAMTMLLKVDAATLAAARADQAITGTLVREGDEWWLREVRPADNAAETK